MKRIKDGRPTATKNSDPKSGLQITERQDTIDIISVSDEIKTVEQALEKAQIDLKLWRVTETSINTWEVAGKIHRGQDSSGNWRPQALWKNSLWQVKVKLARRAPKPIQDGILDLLSELKPPKWKKAPRRKREGLLVELSLCDAHFGKRCWGEETGEVSYDLDIAASDYANSADELLGQIRHFSVGKIILPIGNDLFNANNWAGTTARGTLVESVDDRFQKVFRVCCRAVRHTIECCREIADVEALWVPGNHDIETSWYLCEFLRSWFRGDPHVKFDNGPQERKYRSFGATLLGYTHGHELPFAKLPLLMAVEAPQEFAAAKYRAWRLGHFHKKKETEYNVGDTYNGVKVDVLPSLSGSDKWHYQHGFVHNTRAAEIYLWDKKDGYVGHFATGMQSDKEPQ